jgi:hypothetical protein
MGQMNDLIVTSGAVTLRYAEGLLKDIKPAQFARYPSPGGVVITTNHPAFVYGHLGLYAPRVLAMVGMASAGPANPDGFEALFANGKPCLDDPAGTIYPSMDVITAHFLAGTRAALAAMPKVDEAVLARANPAEGRFREMFPTIGSAANFMLGAHGMSHLGQVSAWRRCMGLGSAT